MNAPRKAKVTLGGFVMGNTKITVTAPGGTVVFANTGRADGRFDPDHHRETARSQWPAERRDEGECDPHRRRLAETDTGGRRRDSHLQTGRGQRPGPVIEKGTFTGGAKLIAAK